MGGEFRDLVVVDFSLDVLSSFSYKEVVGTLAIFASLFKKVSFCKFV